MTDRTNPGIGAKLHKHWIPASVPRGATHQTFTTGLYHSYTPLDIHPIIQSMRLLIDAEL